MQCPGCHAENREGRRFCGECGLSFALTCPSCGFLNEGSEKFCGGCGAPIAGSAAAPEGRFGPPESYTPKHLAEKILTSKSALEGERKQVTVLFADVSGFTSISERLDPEEVHQLMTRTFELMLAEVHRYEGTVNQFLGDGIMALFGAPIAHEYHGQGAVHAALGIRAALESLQDELRGRGLGFQVRQGLNTGLVVVGSIGDDLRMDYTAVGDTTNVAARFQQTADPGRIVISESTHRLVAGYFHLRPLGELALKGKKEPVRAWEVISARGGRTRLEIEAERGLTPLIGRERETRTLLDCFDKARAGHGQVALIMGEPGIGKSRLLYELRRRLAEDATWLEGHPMSFGRSMAFHPVVDLLKRNFRIAESDDAETIDRKIERGVVRLGEDLRPILPYVRYVLSIDPGDPAILGMEPGARRAGVFNALRRLTLRAAEVHPQVLVFEDLQWMDKATEDYVTFMGESVVASRILVILTYRPGYVHPFGEHTYHTRITLDALSTEESVRMAQAALATGALPEELEALIVRKAEGNPFFLEEVVKTLQEGGAIRAAGDHYVLARPLDDIFVPDTVQDIIMARIDRLEETAKTTLQLASVIGREFTRRLLDRIAEISERMEEILRELKAIELIYEKRVFPEAAYMFKHALTQDVAYNSLLVQRRKALHRTIGAAIEELYGGRLAEQYEVLAYHFAKSEEWTKAVHYLRQAGAKAEGRGGNLDAVAYYEQALQALAHLPDTRQRREQALDLCFELRRPLFQLGQAERMLACLREAEVLADGLGDHVRKGWVLAHLGGHAWFTGDQAQALELAQRGYDIATTAGDFTLRIHTSIRVGWAHHALGDYRRAIDFFRESASLEGDLVRERFGHVGLPSVMSHSYLAWCLAELGEFADGLAHGEEALRVADAADHPFSRMIGGAGLGVVHLLRGDLPSAIAVLERHHQLSAAISVAAGNVFIAPFLGLAYARSGRADDALTLLRPVVEFTGSRNLLLHQPLRLAALAEASLLAGRIDDALTHAGRALELARRLGERAHEAYARRLLGEIAGHREPVDVAAAEGQFREGTALAADLGMRPLVALCYLGIGALYRRAGRREEAETSTATGAAMLQEMGAEPSVEAA